MLSIRLAVLAVLVVSVAADMYLHNPPGSNDRNRERNDNRNNANRLFNSQNNAKGGYPWRGDPTRRAEPDPITYYTGSMLRLEWTNQHSCGPNKNIHCEVVIQYGCDDEFPGMRDGYPDSANLAQSDNQNAGYMLRQFSGEAGQNQDGTNTIPENQFPNDPVKTAQFYYQGMYGGVEFGMHEGIDWYNACKTTERNRGLYAADQAIQVGDARGTRQNPNAERNGLECPEERDYYPYWRPVPWRDIAVLVSDPKYCDFFTQNSQNVATLGYCNCSSQCQSNNGNLIPNNPAKCIASQGQWVTTPPLGGGPPPCLYHPFGRDNHLGNIMTVDADGNPLTVDLQPETAHYNFQIPQQMAGKNCAIRYRYNISTYDYPSRVVITPNGDPQTYYSDKNCPNTLSNSIKSGTPTAADIISSNVANKPQCQGILNATVKPLFNRPYVQLFPNTPSLSLAINTNQAGRTFQDRSHLFHVENRPSSISNSATIWNLNIRGRRGNIVQCYPAVEYDFVPNQLQISDADLLHIQIHGSDFNEAKNANNAEGWQYSDRSNMVQFNEAGDNYPTPLSQQTLFGLPSIAQRWALLDQSNCGTFNRDTTNEANAITNCGKLNSAPNRFPPNPADGLVSVSAGTYYYSSTRNNNFSNRSQKATLWVSSSGLTAAQVAAISVGTIGAAGAFVGGVFYYGKRNPNSFAGTAYAKVFGGGAVKTAAPAPDMEYVRASTLTK